MEKCQRVKYALEIKLGRKYPLSLKIIWSSDILQTIVHYLKKKRRNVSLNTLKTK
jgi:hypothetical protein